MATWTKAITDPLNAASDLAQGLMSLRDITKLGGVVVQLNAQIIAAQRGALTAQQNETEMAEKIGELKKEIVGFETWNEEKQRYEFKNAVGNALVYMLKKDARGTEPPHWVCAHCYGNRQAEVLQYEGIIQGQRGHRWSCPSCKNSIIAGPDSPRWVD